MENRKQKQQRRSLEENVSSPIQSKPSKEDQWTKEEMEKVQPYPMPTVSDNEKQD